MVSSSTPVISTFNFISKSSNQLADSSTHLDIPDHKLLESIISNHLKPTGSIPISIQFSIHSCSASLFENISTVFPELNHKKDLFVIPTFQKSMYDLVGIGGHIEQEKDRLLELFFIWGITIALKFRQMGFWSDLTDPASGCPVLGERGAGFYSDVQGSLALLKYKTTMAGCCGMIVHPTWGTKSYPATLFVKAPLHVIQNFFDKIVN